jgi:hypothetical protein
METTETVVDKNIQQAVIEKLALLSFDKQRQALDFIEELARSEPTRSKFRPMFEEAAKDVPPEAWDEVPSDASSNIDHYLYGAPKK